MAAHSPCGKAVVPSSKTAGAVDLPTWPVFMKSGGCVSVVSLVQTARYGEFGFVAEYWAREIPLELGNIKIVSLSKRLNLRL